MPASKSSESSRPLSNKIECTICHKKWDTKGFGNHRRACEKKNLLALQQREYEEKREASNPTCTFYLVSAAEYLI
jgi:hypothetical protein